MKCEECGSIMERIEFDYESGVYHNKKYQEVIDLIFVCHKCKNYVKEEYKRKEQ